MGADETVFHKIDREYSTEFVGYDTMEAEAVIDFIATDDELIEAAGAGDEIYIVSKLSPFYAESGGQVGDRGEIITPTGRCEVVDTQKAVGGKISHKAKVVEGAVEVGQTAQFKVDSEHRLAVMRNHSCAHLLQSALRAVLGDHVHQAGQLVDGERLRFDFSHFSAMTLDEIQRTEMLVNSFILRALEITTREMPIEEAKKLGAMALFGEKYGETVRVVTMGDASIEFCGGTHMDNTSKIGLFKIVSESSVAAGVRRIEAVTGKGVLDVMSRQIGMLNEASGILKLTNQNELVARVKGLMEEIRALEKDKSELSAAIAEMRSKALMDHTVDVKGVKLITAMFNPMKPDEIRMMAETIRDKNPEIVCVIAGVNGKAANLCVTAGKEAVAKGVMSGKVIGKIAAITGGKGGGRPDSAMAGVGDIFKIDEALAAAQDIIAEFIKD